jgi:hypothetical protein
MDTITLTKEQAEKIADFLYEYRAYLDTQGYQSDPEWEKKMDQAEELIGALAAPMLPAWR